MLIITNPIRLYGRKVVTDLALRSGCVNANSFSASNGLASLVDKMWSEPTFASKEALFQDQVDFDADLIQPHFTEYDYDAETEEFERETPYNPAVDKTDFDRYYRRLEEIAEDYLEKYVCNLVYTICRLSGGAKAFNYKHAVAPTLFDVEDNTATELADLETDGQKDAWSEGAINEALTRMPYVLKRLHNLSRYTGIHMLSFVSSYIVAREKNQRMRMAGSTRLLKRNAVISENVWACDRMGNATHKIAVSNKNLKAYEMFDWIEGEVDKYQAYKEDVTNFMHYVKVLNIDITDDMQKYGQEFVSKLSVTTLTPNTQYNPDIYKALLTGAIVQQGNTPDLLSATVSRFREMCIADPSLARVLKEFDSKKQRQHFEVAKEIYSIYCLSQGIMCKDALFEFYDGYLYYSGELAVMGTSLVSNTVFSDPRCLISELGFLVHVSDTLTMHLLSIYWAKENMYAKIGKDKEQKLESWWLVSL